MRKLSTTRSPLHPLQTEQAQHPQPLLPMHVLHSFNHCCPPGVTTLYFCILLILWSPKLYRILQLRPQQCWGLAGQLLLLTHSLSVLCLKHPRIQLAFLATGEYSQFIINLPSSKISGSFFAGLHACLLPLSLYLYPYKYTYIHIIIITYLYTYILPELHCPRCRIQHLSLFHVIILWGKKLIRRNLREKYFQLQVMQNYCYKAIKSKSFISCTYQREIFLHWNQSWGLHYFVSQTASSLRGKISSR